MSLDFVVANVSIVPCSRLKILQHFSSRGGDRRRLSIVVCGYCWQLLEQIVNVNQVATQCWWPTRWSGPLGEINALWLEWCFPNHLKFSKWRRRQMEEWDLLSSSLKEMICHVDGLNMFRKDSAEWSSSKQMSQLNHNLPFRSSEEFYKTYSRKHELKLNRTQSLMSVSKMHVWNR